MTDKETFRHVIGHFASGVTVLTARNGDADFGATASAVSSLSLEPPMLLVCLNTRSSTQQAIQASRTFGVNILDEDQGIVAERFASPHSQKFEGLKVERGEASVPLVADSLAYCECRVTEDVLAGTHRVFLASVTRAVAREGSPLTYFRGRFGRFEVEQDRIVLDQDDGGLPGPHGDHQADGSCPSPDVGHGLPCPRLHGGGQQNGVGAGAVPTAELPQPDPPAQKAVFADVFGTSQARRFADPERARLIHRAVRLRARPRPSGGALGPASPPEQARGGGKPRSSPQAR